MFPLPFPMPGLDGVEGGMAGMPMPDENALAQMKNLTEMVNLCEISMRRVIAMAKRLGQFRRLSQADQMSLLKGGSIELLVLRGVLSFDREKQTFLGLH